jgi:tetratricopeptide (TPR) repeat protein
MIFSPGNRALMPLLRGAQFEDRRQAMNRVHLFKIAASSLVLGAGVTAFGVGGDLFSSAANARPSAKNPAAQANYAAKMLAKGKIAKAVAAAEAAVAIDPGNAEYRALLGQAYLASGRFESARLVLTDAVSLNPQHGRAALNLALAQSALAKQDEAIATLNAAQSVLAPADYGLALALAGHVDHGVTVLEGAARMAEATAKSRQNLALAYAMANRWGEARAVAAQDLAPDVLDQRMTEWVSFVRPQASWDQVATLLGVKAVWDPGMPSQLALARPAAEPAAEPAAVETAVAPVPAEPVAEAIPVSMAVPAEPTPEEEVVPAFEFPVREAPAPAVVPAVVQPVTPKAPALIKADTSPVKQSVVPTVKAGEPVKAAKAIESGNFVVQLGAFSSLARAQTAWKGASTKTRELANYDMATPRVTVKAASLYRLSVSGFTSREAAGQVCTRVRAAGGQCFVRSLTESKPMLMARKPSGGKSPVRVAAR